MSFYPRQSAADRPLQDRTVAFTGRLASMSRREAWHVVREGGGRPSDRVTGRTDLLVVGMHGWAVLADGAASRKLLEAESRRDRGQSLTIVSEDAFLEGLGRRPPRPDAGPRSCTLEGACRLLDVPLAVVERCEQFGLIRAVAGAIDFQDLVSLRAVVTLLRQGLTPSAVALALSRLAVFLPEMERPLAQARLVSDRGEILAELRGARMNIRGQLLFDFAGTAPPVPGVSRELAERRRQGEEDAEQWFLAALDGEDEGDREGAREAYGRALAIDPGFVEARYNLANLHLAADRLAEAEIEYRAVLDADPELACAWYNLGYVLAEREEFEEAAAVLRRAVALLPEYADAHFNLALCCEELGWREEAVRHWRIFLRLQPNGEWTEIARAHLKGSCKL